jgi:two-component system, NarL family, sensor kinase
MHKIEKSRRTDVTAPLLRFFLTGLAAVIVVGVLAVVLLRQAAHDEAIRDARATARLAGTGIVGPAVTDALLRGDEQAIREMDALVRREIRRDGVVRVKLWTQDGKVVYSDQRSLIGETFPVEEDSRELKIGQAEAELTDLSRDENRQDGLSGELLEVYMPIQTDSGQRLVFELYEEASSIGTDAKKTLVAFLPALIGALIVLQLLQLPLAHSLVSRLQRTRAEREALMLRAIAASDTERRRIASDLHDGVVQDLAGTSYALAAAADRVDAQEPAEASQVLRDAAHQTRRSIRQLRSLLVDIYPPDLHRAGLAAALSDLVAPLESRGLDTKLELPPSLRLQPDTEALMFRTAQEALRNVIQHSGADRVDVSVELFDHRAGLKIHDDGRGFTAADAEEARDDGHLGLRVLADMAQDAGGRLEISSEPGEGTRVWLEVPVA